MWLFHMSSLRDCENRECEIAIPPKRHGMAFVKSCIVVNQGILCGTIPKKQRATDFQSVD